MPYGAWGTKIWLLVPPIRAGWLYWPVKTSNAWLCMFFLLTKRGVTWTTWTLPTWRPYSLGAACVHSEYQSGLSPLPCYPLFTSCYWQFRNSQSLGLWFDGKMKKSWFSHYFPERFAWPYFWTYIHCDSLKAWEPEVQTAVETVTCGLWMISASATYWPWTWSPFSNGWRVNCSAQVSSATAQCLTSRGTQSLAEKTLALLGRLPCYSLQSPSPRLRLMPTYAIKQCMQTGINWKIGNTCHCVHWSPELGIHIYVCINTHTNTRKHTPCM